MTDLPTEPFAFHPLRAGMGGDHLDVAFAPKDAGTPASTTARHGRRSAFQATAGHAPRHGVGTQDAARAALAWGAVGLGMGVALWLPGLVAPAWPLWELPAALTVGGPMVAAALMGGGLVVGDAIADHRRTAREHAADMALDWAALSRHAAAALRALHPTLPYHPDATHLSCTATWNPRPHGMALVDMVVWLHGADRGTLQDSTALDLHRLSSHHLFLPLARCAPGLTADAWAATRPYLLAPRVSTRAMPYASAHQRLALQAVLRPTGDGEGPADRAPATSLASHQGPTTVPTTA